MSLISRWFRSYGRARRLIGALCVSTLGAFVFAVAPAGALVTPIGAPQFGVEPHSNTTFAKEPTLPLTYHGGPVMHSTNTYAIYWDPTLNPAGQYDGDWKANINQYLSDVGSASGSLNNVYAVASLYTDSGGGRAAYRSTFRGASTDGTPYPVSGCTDPHPTAESLACLTDAQIRSELTGFVSAHGLPTGLGTIYFLLTPPGVTVCTDGGTVTGHCSDSKPASTESYEHSFCSYHSFTGSGANAIVYAMQPWTAGTSGTFDALTLHNETDCQSGSAKPQQEPNQIIGADIDGDFDAGLSDLIVNQISVEQLATETNPLLNGWYAPEGQANAGNEMPDQCRNWFEPKIGGSFTVAEGPSESGTAYNQLINGHSYYLNTAYDQAALTNDYPGVACIPGVSLMPLFTAPNPVNAGDVVGYDASESNVALGAVTYTWNFGDGSAPVFLSSPAAVFHSFTYGGTYNVTLAVTDGGGNSSSVTNPTTVVGPPPPSTAVTPAGPGSAGTTAAGTSSPASSGGNAQTVANPVATAAALSHSLRKALRDGLVIRYSVNEQVTGHFEVLLNRSLAHSLGIGGAPALGLPAGSAPEVVIGKAILVTTEGGRNTVKIQFSKNVSSRLGRLKKVSLLLRLVVRNASSQSPASVTALSTVTLTH